MSPRKTNQPKTVVMAARMTQLEAERVIRALRQPGETLSAMTRRVLLAATTRAKPAR